MVYYRNINKITSDKITLFKLKPANDNVDLFFSELFIQ